MIFIIIDPELQSVVKELTINKTTEFMQDMGANTEQISEAVDGIREQDNYSISSQIKGYFSTLLVFSIIGSLISLILKKKREE